MNKNQIEEEKEVVEVMIRLYCTHKERNVELCESCAELLEYAKNRLDRCPFADKKGSCKNCSIHCYKATYRIKMQEIMRFAGPRMLFYHPVMAIRHLWSEKISKYRSE